MLGNENYYTGNSHNIQNGQDVKRTKRQEEDEWKKEIKRKLKEEEAKLIGDEAKNDNKNVAIYKLLNDLQGISRE